MEAFQYSGIRQAEHPVAIKTSAPSNIALVKYWGKHGEQLPKNPSVSFTLDHCQTQTEVVFSPADPQNNGFSFVFDGEPKPDFHPKLDSFFNKIKPYCPYLDTHHMAISSRNTFPHSSGIASSASAMAALATALLGLEKHFTPELDDTYFWQKASFLARLGSGSAARSLQGPLMLWGQTPHYQQSSDIIAVPLTENIHSVFQNYRDTILLVDRGQKKVSSTQGHQLMHGHPYAAARFQQAEDNTARLLSILQQGDVDAFIPLVESEALSLHALMMSSHPYFILMHPNTLHVLDRVWDFRQQSKIPLCFTLDAGANVHLLYPDEFADAVQTFIQSDLSSFCQAGQYIDDQVGSGAKIY
ncbi:MAG: diphosphomevalonate/mevalonate 3,5-bisphosphate decarboxylase family protein [Flavobacteriaceae bacterium]